MWPIYSTKTEYIIHCKNRTLYFLVIILTSPSYVSSIVYTFITLLFVNYLFCAFTSTVFFNWTLFMLSAGRQKYRIHHHRCVRALNTPRRCAIIVNLSSRCNYCPLRFYHAYFERNNNVKRITVRVCLLCRLPVLHNFISQFIGESYLIKCVGK